jgi:hypothetical protein
MRDACSIEGSIAEEVGDHKVRGRRMKVRIGPVTVRAQGIAPTMDEDRRAGDEVRRRSMRVEGEVRGRPLQAHPERWGHGFVRIGANMDEQR